MRDEELEIYLAIVAKLPELSRSEEKHLLKKARGNDEAAVQRLAESYLWQTAQRALEFYQQEGWRGFSRSEAVHAGNVGLFLAIRRTARVGLSSVDSILDTFIECELAKLL